MAYYAPLELTRGGGWHYTCTNGAGTFPLGYCCTQRMYDMLKLTWDEAGAASRCAYGTREHYEAERAKQMQFFDKYHVHGHATADEAIRCYHEYLVDQMQEIHKQEAKMERCKVCGDFTQNVVSFRGGSSYAHMPMCDQHTGRVFVLSHMWTPYEQFKKPTPYQEAGRGY